MHINLKSNSNYIVGLRLLLHLLHPCFELREVNRLGMFTHEQIDDLLFEIILNILLVEPS